MLVATATALAIVAAPRWVDLRVRRRERETDEPRFYAAVGAELRAGASLRHALADAAGEQDSAELHRVRRITDSGAPIDEVAAELGTLSGSGRQAAVALRVAERSGGRAAEVFQRLADRASDAAELERQQRVLTAQSRMSALIVGGLPFVWLAFGGISRLETLVANGGIVIAVVGLGLQALGIVVVWRLASS